MCTLDVEMVCMCKIFFPLTDFIYTRELTCRISSWNPEGVLLGIFAVANGNANFAFVPGGMYIFNEYKLYKVTLQAEGREVKRDFGLY
jgi:hypothetical protein